MKKQKKIEPAKCKEHSLVDVGMERNLVNESTSPDVKRIKGYCDNLFYNRVDLLQSWVVQWMCENHKVVCKKIVLIVVQLLSVSNIEEELKKRINYKG